MSIPRERRPRRKWPFVFAALVLLESGCSALNRANRPERRSGPEPRPPQSSSGPTISTDQATVEPGRTIAPPSLGVDLTSVSPAWGSSGRSNSPPA